MNESIFHYVIFNDATIDLMNFIINSLLMFSIYGRRGGNKFMVQ